VAWSTALRGFWLTRVVPLLLRESSILKQNTNKMVLLARQGGLTGTIYSVGEMDSTNKQALSKLPRFSTARAQKSKQ